MIDRQFMLAAGTLIGTAIGAGTFALPYVTARAGFFPVIAMFIILAIFTVYSNLMYGEISLRTRNNCRLTGYAQKYFGPHGRRFAAVITFLSLYSSALVYIILGGIFLNSLFAPIFGGNEFTYGIVIFLLTSFLLYFNFSIFAFAESWMVVAMLAAMAGIVFKAVPHLDLSNFSGFHPSHLFLPFGTILFSLSASMAIPDFEHIITKRQGRIKEAILYGTAAYAFLYIIFIVAVLGVTGGATSEDSLSGLQAAIGDGVVTFGLVFGLLAVLTSYLETGIALRETLHYDYNISKNRAWFWSCSIPFLFFVLGLRDFIQVITYAGSVTGGFLGIMIILLFYRAKRGGDMEPAYSIDVSQGISALMIFVYILGIAYTLIYPN